MTDPTRGGPPAVATRDIVMPDGAVVRLRRHGCSEGPRLVLSHGNGFAMDGYAPFWSLLAETFDIVLFDLRNHGCNPRHRREDHRLDRIVADYPVIRASIDAAFAGKPTVGLFHSISAIAAILAAGEGLRWDALVLVDPPLAPPADHPLRAAQTRLDEMLGAWAERRPDSVGTLEEYAAELEGARPYARCVPGAARLMAEATTRPRPDGQRELACPGAWEAAIYRDNSDSNSFDTLGKLGGPLMLVGADPTLPGAGTPALLTQDAAARFALPYAPISGATHMLQIEQPDAVANVVSTFLGSALPSGRSRT